MFSLNQTLRHFRKHTFQTVLIVSAMVLAMVAALFIKGWVAYQQSYDHHYPEDIYRATISYHMENGTEQNWARVNVDWINELPEAFPEVEALVRFQSFRPRNVIIGKQKYKEKYAYSVDSQIFDVFDLKLIRGIRSALNDPNAVVLTEASATKYFGSVSSAMHQSITLDSSPDQREYTVKGVMANPPDNTHLPITLLSSINRPEDRSGWACVYLKMRNPEAAKTLAAAMDTFIAAHHHDEGVVVKVDIQPISDIYLHSNASREIIPPGQPQVIQIFGWVLVLIVVIATANFILFNSTRMLSGFKALSLRKILGASTQHLKLNMLLEAGVMLVLSFMVAMGLTYLLLPFAEAFFETSFNIGFAEILNLAGWFITSGLVGLGVYLLLFKRICTELKPVDLLEKRRFGAREALLTLQFALTFGILTSFLFINHQLDYMLSSTKGLNTNQVLAVTNFHTEVSDELAGYQQDISRIAGIKASAGLMQLPSQAIKDQGSVSLQGVYSGNNGPMMDIQVIDQSFFHVLEIPFLAGTGFPEYLINQESAGGEASFIAQINGKQQAYIINESAAKELGFTNPEEALQQHMSWSNAALNLQTGQIVGVVADYHQEGFTQKIDPTVFIYEPMLYRNLVVKIASKNPTVILEQMETKWNDRFSELPFEYAFLDEEYARLYQQEQSTRKLFSAFTTIAILILIAGLIGLLTFELQRRLKELAIRKALGAYFGNLMTWITKPYWYMMGGSFALIAPICYWLLQDWVATYAYQANMNLSVWVIPIISVSTLFVLVCLLIVKRYSSINPMDILRSE